MPKIEINPDGLADPYEAWSDGWQRAIDFNNKARDAEVHKLKTTLQRIVRIVHEAEPEEIANQIMRAIALTAQEADPTATRTLLRKLERGLK